MSRTNRESKYKIRSRDAKLTDIVKSVVNKKSDEPKPQKIEIAPEIKTEVKDSKPVIRESVPVEEKKSETKDLPDYSELHNKFRADPFFTIPQQSKIALNFLNVTRGRLPYRAD